MGRFLGLYRYPMERHTGESVQTAFGKLSYREQRLLEERNASV